MSKHKRISYIKSTIRVVGLIAGVAFKHWEIGFIGLLIAEIFGYFEEEDE